MSSATIRSPGGRATIARLGADNRGVLIALFVFLALLGLVNFVSSGPLTYFDISFLSSGGATLALASVGQTLVILSGGFDLSAGAVISLVNVVLAQSMDPMTTGTSVVLWTLAGIGIGMLTGAFNGFFVAVLRLQPIVVTLSTMFILQGVTLLVMDKPGGFVSPDFGTFYLGDAIPGFLPMPVALILAVVAVWLWLKNTRFGPALYAVGSDPDAAAAAGVRVVFVRFMVYVIAGGCYGLAGVFISAQTGSGDPLVGNSLLLSMFAAVVVGGTRLGGGKGGPVGTVFGAYILMMVVNILLVLNVSAYYSTIAEGTILILAVLAGSASRSSELANHLRTLGDYVSARRRGTLPGQLDRTDRRLKTFLGPPKTDPAEWHGFIERHRETLRFALPAYVCLVLVILVTQLWLGRTVFSPTYWNSLAVLSSFLALLALGQGTVILTGGLDLSVPWVVGISGIVLAGMVNGSDAALVYALPLVLAMAALIGFANGVGVVFLGISPIVMTLAMNGILQGFALLYSQGTPAGFAAPMLRWFMTGRIGPVTPVVLFLFLFVVGAVLLLGKTAFGRRVYAIGNRLRAARLSGISVDRTLLLVYTLSGFCAGLVGVLLTGFSGQASLGMGDDYLLPSIAVVVVGGALITGGRGHYLGMLGGVLLLTALQMLLAGTNLPYATRAILYGLVVLLAVVALREKRT
ncbi:ABC transporter permease [Chelativorans sp. M5D2P16]|uniref:ABC transporter permease n=1 Tax=Chelativorans sp. M5D2P16 TaxID=3095678 RepID=UPI002AC9FE6B|nr:ABC transporter permease [Chelativorans sp. M5D2P16]MDZ5696524.1 ABC transporter permease [Chelativorans sp. M5D2P16]